MSDLLAWMLSVFGFTYIVVYSRACQPVRSWFVGKSKTITELIHCPLCLGFWVGLLAHFCMYSPTQNIIFDMCLSSICSWIGTLAIADIQTRFEEKHILEKKICESCDGSQQPFAQ